MKIYAYRVLGSFLAIFIRLILRKYDPKVVAITGSVGKTGTTKAILHVLRKQFSTRGPIGNYNTDLGVPLTILGMESPGANPFGWLRVVGRALRLAFMQSAFPDVLVLELGADHPGEIRRLARLVRPHVGVVTAIGEFVPVHREFFKTTDQLIKEKQELVNNVRDDGAAVLNADDERVQKMRSTRRLKFLSVGVSNSDAEVRASDLSLSTDLVQQDEHAYPVPHAHMHFTLHIDGNAMPAELAGALSPVRVISALQAVAVARELGMDVKAAVNALKDFEGPPGRLHALPGIKHTVLIDDSYNAAPASTHTALDVLAAVDFGGGRKIACLGTMGELGGQSRKEHRVVGEKAADVCDILMTVGADAKATAESAVEAGMSQDRVFSFAESAECGRFLQERMEKGDTVLVKGSQSTRMEKITREVMAEPERAEKLLVRQSEYWLKR